MVRAAEGEHRGDGKYRVLGLELASDGRSTVDGAPRPFAKQAGESVHVAPSTAPVEPLTPTVIRASSEPPALRSEVAPAPEGELEADFENESMSEEEAEDTLCEGALISFSSG